MSEAQQLDLENSEADTQESVKALFNNFMKTRKELLDVGAQRAEQVGQARNLRGIWYTIMTDVYGGAAPNVSCLYQGRGGARNP